MHLHGMLRVQCMVLPDIMRLFAVCKVILQLANCHRPVATAKHPVTHVDKQSSTIDSDMKTSELSLSINNVINCSTNAVQCFDAVGWAA